MKKVSKYSRKMKLTFLKVATVVSVAGFIVVPTVGSNSQRIKNALQAYKVVVNDECMGYAASEEEANEAYLEARTRMNSDAQGVAYVDASIEVVKQNVSKVSFGPKEQLSDKIYEKLSDEVIVSNQVKAYTIRINDFTVTLASKEDVVKVLESVKGNYDTENQFQVSLKTETNGNMSVKMQNAKISALDVDTVSAVLDGETVKVSAVTESTVIEDGVLAVGFAENVEIVESTASPDNIISVDEAYNAITKEKDEKETYTIQAGDCLYDIAIKYGMTVDQLLALNEGMTINSLIQPGDKIVITVPKPELSVITVSTETYEEAYDAPIEYIEDSSLYIGQTAVVSNGTPGYRQVDAVVTYKDGVPVSSQIINEKVISTPVAKVVRKGTTVAPTYIMPLTWYYYVSDPYGWRAETGSFHGGIDYAAPVNTTVRASRSGYVSYAGWKGTYGNCIEITHPDGHMTRYAHLNSIAVSYGQQVSQWETIGYVGSTGFSTGYHLHFEIIIGGVQVNPNNWLN